MPQRLALEGARVAMLARRALILKDAAEAVRSETGATVLPIVADIRKADDIRRAVEETVKTFGAVQIVVNNDGAPPLGRLAGFDDRAWERAVERNFMSVVRMVREATPHLREAGGGSIVNITALSVVQPLIG